MNFQLPGISSSVIKVLAVNPLMQTSRLIIVKILSGKTFGTHQLVDLILLVYVNEKPLAENFKSELIKCAFPCYHSIIISSELPSITDADIFCFMTNFVNPNSLDFNKLDSEEQFDTLYLIIKIASHFGISLKVEEKPLDINILSKKKVLKPVKKAMKPIIVTDGLVALDILMSMSQDLPHDIFFCPTSFTAVSKLVLADHLKVQCSQINDVHVWAANDEVFYVDVEKPFIKIDPISKGSYCDWDAISKEVWNKIRDDHTQFSPAWMKKEFVEKVALNVSKNPYGNIYKAAEISRLLCSIWKSRTNDNGMKSYCSMGVISNGSTGTIKGCPYVLPLILSGDTWTVNTNYDEDSHLRHEIERMNKAIKEHHKKLIPYCKKFLVDNVINQAFVPADDESESIYSLVEEQSSRIS